MFGLVPYPSIVRLILCCLVACLLCRCCCCLREELCTLKLYYPNPQWRFPMWEVLCERIVEILLCESRDVELGARTSKHIFMFVFDPLSLTLSLFYIVPCIISYCSFILICLVLFVRAHTCVKPRELHIAPQLLFREI